MHITHDPVVSAAYIKLRDTEITRTDEADPSVNIDFDIDGAVVGIEILEVSTITQGKTQ